MYVCSLYRVLEDGIADDDDGREESKGIVAGI